MMIMERISGGDGARDPFSLRRSTRGITVAYTSVLGVRLTRSSGTPRIPRVAMPTMETDSMNLNASIMLALTGVVGLALTGYSMLEGDDTSAGLLFIGTAIAFGSLAVATRRDAREERLPLPLHPASARELNDAISLMRRQLANLERTLGSETTIQDQPKAEEANTK